MKKLALIFALCPLLLASRSFNGSTDVITMNGTSTPIAIVSGPETISLWMYPTTVDSNIRIAAAILNGTSSGSQFTVGLGAAPSSATNSMAYIFGCCGAFGPSYTSCGTITVNKWYQVVIWIDTAGKYSSGSASGILVSGGTSCSNFISATSASRSCCAPLTIGVQDTIHPFAGYVADVVIWNDILSPGERAALGTVCANSKKIRPQSIVGAWPLYGASGASTEPDLSGNVLNGTLTGTVAANGPPCTP